MFKNTNSFINKSYLNFMIEYPLIFGIILLSGYITFRLLDRLFGYHREKQYLDKLLEYSVFGTAGFLVVYLSLEFLFSLLNKNFNFDSYFILCTPFIILSSFSFGCIYEITFGKGRRKKSATLFHFFHKNKYKGGWVIIHLIDGQIFWGKLGFSDIDEPDKCIFSIINAKRLNKNYKVTYKYSTELVFDVKDIVFIEYVN